MVDDDEEVEADEVVDAAGAVVEVVGEDVELVAGLVEVGVGARASGASPTWESASPTICQVSTVVRTSAATHAAVIFQEIMGRLSQPPRHREVKGGSRFAQVQVTNGLSSCHRL